MTLLIVLPGYFVITSDKNAIFYAKTHKHGPY